jgi:hypothetical protein
MNQDNKLDIIFEFNMICFRRSILILLLTFTLLSLGGCASTPAPLSPESRMQLGRVGVLALSSTPSIEFHTFAKGWAAGAAKGGAVGVVNGLLNSLGEAIRNQPTGPYAVPAILITTVVMTTVSTLAYGVSGGLEAVPAKTAQRIQKELNAAIGDANLANDLAEKICTVAVSRTDLERYAVIHLGLSQFGTTAAYDDLAKQDIDTAMEVQITEAGFRGGSGFQPSVRFYLNARIRLLATHNGTEIYTRDFQYLSREHPFAEWFSDGSKELLSGFGQAMVTLADRIVDELFIVTNFPFDTGLWALPGQPEFGSCWIRPIYPELKYTSLWYSIRHNSPGINICYTEVDSLQPLFRWEAFPRPRDQKSSNAAVLSQITDVTYDLKIWEANSDYPERLVYDISGLHDPQHRPTFPLKQMTKYFWAIRTRYKLTGQSQVTRWAFSSIPSNVPSDYPQRRPGGTCDLDNIPSTNYFRFITP